MTELKRPDGCPRDIWIQLNQQQRVDVIVMCSTTDASARRVRNRIRAAQAAPVTIKKGEGMQ